MEIERSPTVEEIETVRRRMARKRGATRGPGDERFVAVLAIGLIVGALVLADGPVRWILVASGAFLAACAGLAVRRRRRSEADRMVALDAEERTRLARIRELRFEGVRVVAVSDPDGEGLTYWACELPSGDWLVLSIEQFDDGDEPEVPWARHMTIALDGRGTIVGTAGHGPSLEVLRQDIRPPDFEVTTAHRYWSPAEGTRLPAVVPRAEFDPVA